MAASIRSIFSVFKNSSSFYCCQRNSLFRTTTPLTWCQFLVYRGQVRQHGNSNENTACNQSDSINEKIALNSKFDVEQTGASRFDPDDASYERTMGKSEEEQNWRSLLRPDQPTEARLLRVAIIGTPNAGKSTLTNQLMRWKVSSVSQKVHTTRHNVKAVLTEDDTQIIFVDTPGLLHPKQRKKHHLEMTLVSDPERSLESADLIAVLQDVSNSWTRNQLDPLVLQILHLYSHLPSILILNKVDLLNKKSMLLQMTRSLTEGIVDGTTAGVHTQKTSQRHPQIEKFLSKYEEHIDDEDTDPDLHCVDEDITQNENIISDEPGETESVDDEYTRRHIIPVTYKKKVYSQSRGEGDGGWTEYHEKKREIQFKIRDKNGWPNFSHVFMVSALTGDGVDELREHLQNRAVKGDWEYHSSLVTDQDPFQLACTYVWEKMLEHLPREIPYHLYPEVELWEVDSDGVLNVLMNIPTKDRYYFFNLLGKKGETISKITHEAKQELMNAFRCDMRLKLSAKLKTK